MRRFAPAVLALLFVAPAALRAAPPARVERTLSLDESKRLALQNNQKLLAADNEIRISQQRILESKAQYYPQVGLNMNGSHYMAEHDWVMPSEFGGTLLPRSHNLDPDTFYSARVWMSQPLYTGGRLYNNLLLAKANQERARIQYEEVRSQVVFDVIKAFNDVLLARKEIELHEASLGRLEALSRRVADGDAGKAARIEAVRARLRRALSERRRQEEKAHLSFLDTLGIELYTVVGLDGNLETTPVRLDLAKILAWAQESRLEIQQTVSQTEIDRLAVNLSQAERYPVVAFGAGYELNDQRFPLESTHWTATLNVSLPLFDGFSSHAQIRQKRLQANFSRIQKTDIEDKINFEVRDAYADLMHWQDELEAREADADRSKDSAARLEKRPDPAEAAQALEWLVEADEAYWQAVYGHRVALAKLERAVGRPIQE